MPFPSLYTQRNKKMSVNERFIELSGGYRERKMLDRFDARHCVQHTHMRAERPAVPRTTNNPDDKSNPRN